MVGGKWHEGRGYGWLKAWGVLRVGPRIVAALEFRSMGNAAERLIESFEALPDLDKREVLCVLLRHAIASPYPSPADEDLLHAADQVFQDLDRRKKAGIEVGVRLAA